MSLNALFVTSSVIGIGEFLASLFADQSAQTNVRICAGLNGQQDLSGADGKVASIHTTDANGDLLGISNSVSVGSGGYTDTGVDQPNNEQATGVQLVSDSDAICVAYVSTTWVDGTKWMWVGDWGQPCGLNWYYSGITAGTESDGSGHVTQCTWLDSDGSVDGDLTTAGSLYIGVSEYGNKGLVGNDPSSTCNLPMLEAWTDSDATDVIFSRRDSQAEAGNGLFSRSRTPSMPVRANGSKRSADTRAVVSEHASHNATYLCEHPNSKGPDFVSLAEGKACDMETRQVLDLCTDDITTNCYDTKTDKVVGGKKRAAKSYSKVIRW